MKKLISRFTLGFLLISCLNISAFSKEKNIKLAASIKWAETEPGVKQKYPFIELSFRNNTDKLITVNRSSLMSSAGKYAHSKSDRGSIIMLYRFDDKIWRVENFAGATMCEGMGMRSDLIYRDVINIEPKSTSEDILNPRKFSRKLDYILKKADESESENLEIMFIYNNQKKLFECLNPYHLISKCEQDIEEKNNVRELPILKGRYYSNILRFDSYLDQVYKPNLEIER